MKPIYVYPKDQEVVIHLNDDRDKSTACGVRHKDLSDNARLTGCIDIADCEACLTSDKGLAQAMEQLLV